MESAPVQHGKSAQNLKNARGNGSPFLLSKIRKNLKAKVLHFKERVYKVADQVT